MCAETNLILRAALNPLKDDVHALEDIIFISKLDSTPIIRLAALLVCDSSPPPLATLAVAVRDPELSPDIMVMARRALPEALNRLAQDDAADLRYALWMDLVVFFGRLGSDIDDSVIAELARFAVVSDDAMIAGAVMNVIGAARWRDVPEEMRTAMLDAACRSPFSAVNVAAIWSALDDRDRERAARGAAHPEAAAELLELIGAEGWLLTPEAEQQALLKAVCEDPWQAARGGGAVWTALRAEDRDRIAQTVATSAHAAAALSERIRRHGQAQSDAVATTHSPIAERAASSGCDLFRAPDISDFWASITDDERERIAQREARDASKAVELLEGIGRSGWAATPASAQALLLSAVADDPLAAAKAILALGSALDRPQKMRLLHAMFVQPSRDEMLVVAQSLHNGAPWRDWMIVFAPGVNADAEVKEAWRTFARYLSQYHAAALLVHRR